MIKRIELNFNDVEIKRWAIEKFTYAINKEDCEIIEMDNSMDYGGDDSEDKYEYLTFKLKIKQPKYELEQQ